MLISLGLLLHAVATAPCPDLSGRYHIPGEDGYVTVIIAQSRCERVVIEWNILSHPDSAFSRHPLRLDGQLRPDTGWFGSPTQRTSAAFVGDTIVLVGAAPVTGAAPSFVRATFYLVKSGICTRFTYGRASAARGGTFAWRVVPGKPFATEAERDNLQEQCATRGRLTSDDLPTTR